MQNYVRNLVDFRNSVVGHLENFDRVAAYLAAGDNVVMLANHQTEADPGAHPLLPRSVLGLAWRWSLPVMCPWLAQQLAAVLEYQAPRIPQVAAQRPHPGCPRHSALQNSAAL